MNWFERNEPVWKKWTGWKKIKPKIKLNHNIYTCIHTYMVCFLLIVFRILEQSSGHHPFQGNGSSRRERSLHLVLLVANMSDALCCRMQTAAAKTVRLKLVAQLDWPEETENENLGAKPFPLVSKKVPFLSIILLNDPFSLCTNNGLPLAYHAMPLNLLRAPRTVAPVPTKPTVCRHETAAAPQMTASESFTWLLVASFHSFHASIAISVNLCQLMLMDLPLLTGSLWNPPQRGKNRPRLLTSGALQTAVENDHTGTL